MSSRVHSVSRHRSAPPAHKPAEARQSHKAESHKAEGSPREQGKESSQADAHRNRADGAALSEEAREALDAEQPKDARAPGDPKDAGKPGEGQDGEKPEDARDAKDAKDKEIDELKKLLEEMKKQAEEAKKDKEEEAPPEDLGGCCGKSHGSKNAGDKKDSPDPNDVLLQDVAAVKLEKGGAAAGAGQAGHNQAVKGAGRMQQPQQNGGLQAPGALPQGGAALGKLQQDYTQFKQQGAKIRPEVEQLVLSTLGGGAGQPQNGAVNPLGIPGLQGAGAYQQPGIGGLQATAAPRR